MKKLVIRKELTNREYSSISKYFQEIKKLKILSKEEEQEIGKKIKETNDQKSIDKLVNSNVRFVISVAKQYQGHGLTLGDLINEGNLGLIKAASRFDYEKEFRFISYAVWWIRQSILQALTEHSRTIRLPLNQVNGLIKVNRALQQLSQDFEREPTKEELSELLDIKIKKITGLISLSGDCMSIDEPIKNWRGHGESQIKTLIDTIENKNVNIPDDDMMYESTLKEIETSLKVLNEREKEVIILFFGLNNENKMTLGMIGEKFGISKERVRQIRNKSIRLLRCEFKNKEI